MFFKTKNPLREDSSGFKQPNKKSCKFIYKEVFCFCKKLYFFSNRFYIFFYHKFHKLTQIKSAQKKKFAKICGKKTFSRADLANSVDSLFIGFYNISV